MVHGLRCEIHGLRFGVWGLGLRAQDKGCRVFRRKRWRAKREFFFEILKVRIHVIIVTIRWTGLAPWEFEFPFPGSFTSTFLSRGRTFSSWTAS